MWSCPGNMPKYYPGLRDILPDPLHTLSLKGNLEMDIRHVSKRV